MAVRPGVDVRLRSTPVPRSAPSDIGTWFVTGLTDSGPAATPTLIRSMADFERIFGLRQTYSVLYDALDIYFREGGNQAYVTRVVGPAATVGFKNMNDAGAGISLVARVLGPGAGSANVSVGIRAGVGAGTYVVFVVVGGVEVETSPDLIDQNAGVLWAKNSSYIRLTLGATALNPAVVAAGALSAGTDDRASIVDAQWLAVLDAMPAVLGPGQVSAPGRTTDVGHQQLLAHAAATRRTALLDLPDTATVATLQTSALNARNGSQRFGGAFAPWTIHPGVIAGTTRSVPPSAVVAGLLAENDSNGIGPSDPAAGDNGISATATDLTQLAFTDAQRQTLNLSGVNVIRMMFGTARVYGWRSLVDPIADSDWVDLGHARLYMAIASAGYVIGQSYEFDNIDGLGIKLAEFGKDLTGVCMDFYRDGDLYGATPQEAFRVDVGPSVNTLATLAANELHAVIHAKFSPMAEFVQIEISKRPITEGVV